MNFKQIFIILKNRTNVSQNWIYFGQNRFFSKTELKKCQIMKYNQAFLAKIIWKTDYQFFCQNWVNFAKLKYDFLEFCELLWFKKNSAKNHETEENMLQAITFINTYLFFIRISLYWV